VIGTNPWFKKPRATGEKVDSFRMVLKAGSGERSEEIFKARPLKNIPFRPISVSGSNFNPRTREEFSILKSQIATSSPGWGGRRKTPLVFTEHGALQAANVLKSARANKMSVYIMRTFVRLREMALANEKLAHKVDHLENRVNDHDELLIELIREIRKLIDVPKSKGSEPSIGFIIPGKNKRKS
jgi:hypothetical protein